MIDAFIYGDVVMLDTSMFQPTYFIECADDVFIDCLKEVPGAFVIISVTSAYRARMVTASLRGAGCRNFVLCMIPEVEPIDYRRILGTGADQLMRADTHPTLLEAVIMAVRRRGSGDSQNVISKGEFSFNVETNALSISGHPVKLAPQEARTLRAIVLSGGKIISGRGLHEKLYGFDEDAPELKVIDVYISKIRKKIDKLLPGVDFIETSWGRGYRFNINGVRTRYGHDVNGRRKRFLISEDRKAALAERRLQDIEAAAE